MKKRRIHFAQGIAGGFALWILTGGGDLAACIIWFTVGFITGGLFSIGTSDPDAEIDTSLTLTKSGKAAVFVIVQVAAGTIQLLRKAWGKDGIRCGIGKIPCDAGSDLAEHYLAANAITLTPGTITLEEGDTEYTVLCTVKGASLPGLSGASHLQKYIAGRETN